MNSSGKTCTATRLDRIARVATFVATLAIAGVSAAVTSTTPMSLTSAAEITVSLFRDADVSESHDCGRNHLAVATDPAAPDARGAVVKAIKALSSYLRIPAAAPTRRAA